ncbi:MAG: alpha/beta hydrolase [Alphaproteobacteria bacterium]|nr:alpha/beta hydrolase [Alphaproteobacteria bacterium]
MRSRHFHGLSKAGFHRLHYVEWGESREGVPVICIHGLTQNARGFDELARAASLDRWTLCLDVAGRGGSGRLPDPALYDYAQYLADANALIARLGSEQVDIVGTSMGGLIGMFLAAMPGSPVRRLVMNDVGPFIPRAALARIREYVSRAWRFADVHGLEQHMRQAYATFGPLSDAQWATLARQSATVLDDGAVVPHWDPKIGEVFASTPPSDVNMWPYWDQVKCPVLLLRGAESDLLLPKTAAEMTRRGPRAELVEFAAVGHAPVLLDGDQIRPVIEFLGTS